MDTKEKQRYMTKLTGQGANLEWMVEGVCPKNDCETYHYYRNIPPQDYPNIPNNMGLKYECGECDGVSYLASIVFTSRFSYEMDLKK